MDGLCDGALPRKCVKYGAWDDLDERDTERSEIGRAGWIVGGTRAWRAPIELIFKR